ncbi:hypothetical protein E2C01_087289 [Portunus trituberculatus]|uniref:Uncharacterized protein n=1 Tax=Portunus trituberculatus TaxID=210409 RepID=A0A5B7JCX8_PORTR|nr:hypothetical protein [Portunus trituberculatus]
MVCPVGLAGLGRMSLLITQYTLSSPQHIGEGGGGLPAGGGGGESLVLVRVEELEECGVSRVILTNFMRPLALTLVGG